MKYASRIFATSLHWPPRHAFRRIFGAFSHCFSADCRLYAPFLHDLIASSFSPLFSSPASDELPVSPEMHYAAIFSMSAGRRRRRHVSSRLRFHYFAPPPKMRRSGAMPSVYAVAACASGVERRTLIGVAAALLRRRRRHFSSAAAAADVIEAEHAAGLLQLSSRAVSGIPPFDATPREERMMITLHLFSRLRTIAMMHYCRHAFTPAF
jgi:hypothetical protein